MDVTEDVCQKKESTPQVQHLVELNLGYRHKKQPLLSKMSSIYPYYYKSYNFVLKLVMITDSRYTDQRYWNLKSIHSIYSKAVLITEKG